MSGKKVVSSRKPSAKSQTSPAKVLVRELSELRKDFRKVAKIYTDRVDGEIVEMVEAVQSLGAASTPSPQRIHDLRDMLILLRKVQLKPEKGRRKDLKKLDSLVSDLRQVVDAW